jgi:hypothetical protein
VLLGATVGFEGGAETVSTRRTEVYRVPSTAWVQELMLGGHYRFATAPVRRHLGGERVNAALNPGEPAVDIIQENAGRVWDD